MQLYLIRNLRDGTLYVGKTINSLARRWQGHLADARDRKTHLYNAFRKHGVENFAIEPLVLLDDITDEKSLNDAEIKMIRLLQITCRLYNETAGGEGGMLSEEVRRKVSEGLMGNTNCRGKKRSEEYIRKHSAIMTLSQCRRGHKRTPDNLWGKTCKQCQRLRRLKLRQERGKWKL